MIYTSYYGGKQAGTPICISITQKHGYNFQELPLFKPSDALFKFWKNSKKDAEAEKHYTDVFLENLTSELNDKAIDIWLRKVAKSGNDVTLNCHEIKGFCHRHLVGKIIKSKRPELWGGEVSELEEQKVKVDSRPTKLVSEMTWAEILDNKITIIFENKPPLLPEVVTTKPWRVNCNNYAIYGGDLVKIVGGDTKGEWQLERSPSADPSHRLPLTRWVKTSALTQPPEGHETWTDADFNKAKKVG
ncbi:MAG: hypothetical protein ACKPKK_07505 [Dolichospermum sp.]